MMAIAPEARPPLSGNMNVASRELVAVLIRRIEHSVWVLGPEPLGNVGGGEALADWRRRRALYARELDRLKLMLK